MAIWLSPSDLQGAVSNATITACFNDDNTDVLNEQAIHLVLLRAEQEVLSWLAPEFGPPPFTPGVLAQLAADDFLRSAALEYAIAFTFDRHPEFARSSGKERTDRFERANKRMERILDGRQRPPTVQEKPANVGGVVVDNAPRIYADSADGTHNSGDY